MIRFKNMKLTEQYKFYKLVEAAGIPIGDYDKQMRHNILDVVKTEGPNSTHDILYHLIECNWDNMLDNLKLELYAPRRLKRPGPEVSSTETFREVQERTIKYLPILDSLDIEGVVQIAKRYDDLYSTMLKLPFTEKCKKDIIEAWCKPLARAIHILAVDYDIRSLGSYRFLQINQIVSGANQQAEAEYQEYMSSKEEQVE